MERHRKMWLAVEKEHGVLTQREAYVALTAMEWADKTMIEKARQWITERYDLDFMGDFKDLLDYLKSLREE
jgi:hypothetical protein